MEGGERDGYKHFVVSHFGDFSDRCRSGMASQSKLGVLSKWLFWLVATDCFAVIPYRAHLASRVTK